MLHSNLKGTLEFRLRLNHYPSCLPFYGGIDDVHQASVRTLPPREYGASGALVVWPGMPFPNLDGRIHQSLVVFFNLAGL
jgi:hypothetical protein